VVVLLGSAVLPAPPHRSILQKVGVVILPPNALTEDEAEADNNYSPAMTAVSHWPRLPTNNIGLILICLSVSVLLFMYPSLAISILILY